MALCTVYRPAATLVMAIFALRVQDVHPLGRIFAFRIMTFTARGGRVSFFFKVMVAIRTFDAVPIFGKVPFMIKENIAARILEHDPDGIFRGFFCKRRVTHHANQKKSRCQTVGDGPKSLVIHGIFLKFPTLQCDL
jgi:hypothetical protein